MRISYGSERRLAYSENFRDGIIPAVILPMLTIDLFLL